MSDNQNGKNKFQLDDCKKLLDEVKYNPENPWGVTIISEILRHGKFDKEPIIKEYKSFDKFHDKPPNQETAGKSETSVTEKADVKNNEASQNNNEKKNKRTLRPGVKCNIKIDDKSFEESVDKAGKAEKKASEARKPAETTSKITPPTQQGIPRTTPQLPASTPRQGVQTAKPAAFGAGQTKAKEKSLTAVPWPTKFERPKPPATGGASKPTGGNAGAQQTATPSFGGKTSTAASTAIKYKQWNYVSDESAYNYTNTTGEKPKFGSGQTTFANSAAAPMFGAKQDAGQPTKQATPNWPKSATGFGAKTGTGFGGKTGTGFGGKTGTGFGAKAGAFGAKPQGQQQGQSQGQGAQ